MGVSKPDVTRDDLERRIDQAMGRTKADLVIKNTRFLNVVTGRSRRATSPCAATSSSAPTRATTATP